MHLSIMHFECICSLFLSFPFLRYVDSLALHLFVSLYIRTYYGSVLFFFLFLFLFFFLSLIIFSFVFLILDSSCSCIILAS
ncbi:hypothetical protein DFP72DRAFT_922175 [Ephemerocybe angulata]|uniref:Uncharacterized protein n=1 Tax=Ephemerocybe angulata TaxID=980116 RepID=A0A8H6HI18_9AGAR|nr:hypothetical protein DFP72DRAFT_922175 [Tulosesus angulatus]